MKLLLLTAVAMPAYLSFTPMPTPTPTPDLGGGTIVVALVFFAIWIGGILLYFLPSFIAKGKNNWAAIFALNFLAGWTFIGWIVALVWALTKDRPEPVFYPPPR